LTVFGDSKNLLRLGTGSAVIATPQRFSRCYTVKSARHGGLQQAAAAGEPTNECHEYVWSTLSTGDGRTHDARASNSLRRVTAFAAQRACEKSRGWNGKPPKGLIAIDAPLAAPTVLQRSLLMLGGRHFCREPGKRFGVLPYKHKSCTSCQAVLARHAIADCSAGRAHPANLG
jgi:hypothetical protein